MAEASPKPETLWHGRSPEDSFVRKNLLRNAQLRDRGQGGLGFRI